MWLLAHVKFLMFSPAVYRDFPIKSPGEQPSMPTRPDNLDNAEVSCRQYHLALPNLRTIIDLTNKQQIEVLAGKSEIRSAIHKLMGSMPEPEALNIHSWCGDLSATGSHRETKDVRSWGRWCWNFGSWYMLTQFCKGLQAAGHDKLQRFCITSVCPKHIEPSSAASFVLSHLQILMITCSMKHEHKLHPGMEEKPYEPYETFSRMLAAAQPNLAELNIEGEMTCYDSPLNPNPPRRYYEECGKFKAMFMTRDANNATIYHPLRFVNLKRFTLSGMQVVDSHLLAFVNAQPQMNKMTLRWIQVNPVGAFWNYVARGTNSRVKKMCIKDFRHFPPSSDGSLDVYWEPYGNHSDCSVLLDV